MPDFGGTVTAMVTPFDGQGAVDFARTEELADRLVSTGSDAIVVAGTTGESPTLTHDEKLALFSCVVEAAAGRAAIIGGTGNNNTEASIELTREAGATGLDAVMLVGPYYNKPSQEGLYRHFRAIAEQSDLPVVLYNVPPRTSKNIEPKTVLRLAEVPNIVALKEASGDMKQISELCRLLPRDFAIYSGDDFVTLPMLALGARGVISVVSNVAGRMVADMVAAFEARDTARAAELHHALFPLCEACFLESGNPACVKRAMEIAGFPVGGVRLPLAEASEADTERIRAVCERMALVGA
jgi:4-hydroxy-tetrahydrodipicolinate synthase